jgi:hypothetical protein
MDYCHRCGRWLLLNLATRWCAGCTDKWNDANRRPGL